MSLTFTIDEEKLRASLEATEKPKYDVKALVLPAIRQPYPPAPSLVVDGTMMFGGSSVSGSRDLIPTLRRNIEASGTQLKTIEELDREIADMKGYK